ncbi:Mitochondrial substrate carrier family protein B [Linum perenne]
MFLIFNLYRETQSIIKVSGIPSVPYAKRKDTWGYIKELGLHYWPNDSTTMVSLSCGSLSGVAASTATFPIDLVRRRMQLEGAGGKARVYTGGLLGTFRHIIKNEGQLGLYRGILPEYYKVVPGVAIVFMTYETLKI